MLPLHSRARTGPAITTAAALAASAALALGSLAAGTTAHAAVDDGLVLKYNLTETAGTVAEDSSGNGRNGVVSGDATLLGAEGLQLGGSNGYVKLPDDVMRGLDSITVVDFEASAGPSEFANSAITDWQRRVTRRSGL